LLSVSQVRTRVVRSLHHLKALTLGSDAFLLDIVPPSPYHPTDVVHARSRSSDHRDSAGDRDAVVRSPGVLRDRAAAAPGDVAGPSLAARRPTTPLSPPPPPPPSASSRDVYYNGLINAAFVHSDPSRVDPAAAAAAGRHVAGVSGRHVPPTAPVHVANGFSQSPIIPRRRDVDVDDAHRSTAASRPHDDRYLHGHPPPPPAPSSVSAAGAPGRQNSAADVAVSHPAALCGPLSLSTGVLNFSPPAPHLAPNRVRQLFTLSLSLSLSVLCRSSVELLSVSATLYRVRTIPEMFP